jgi:alpha-1,2-mannosyltransferase
MSTTIERGIYALLIVILLAGAFRAADKASEDRSAFNRWRYQLLKLREGVDISATDNYPNPPIMAVLLEPLAYLPPVTGAVCWYLLKVAMAIAAFVGLVHVVEAGGVPFPPAMRVLAALLSLKPVLDDLFHGNVNLFILFLVVACLVARHYRYEALAGLALALAIACKVTPALLVPYFFYKRAWWVLWGTAVGLLLFLAPGLVPAARLGMEHNQRQLISWYKVMVEPFVIQGKVTAEHINQSLPGFTHRMLTRSPSFVVFVEGHETPVRYDNFVALAPETANRLTKLALLGFLGLMVWSCRSPQRSGWQPVAEAALIALGMLLFSERTWKHHAVTLMIPYVALAFGVAREPRLWGVVVGSLVLMLLPGLGGGNERETVWRSPPFNKMVLVYGAYTLLFVLLSATMVWQLRRGASQTRPNVLPTGKPGHLPQAA